MTSRPMVGSVPGSRNLVMFNQDYRSNQDWRCTMTIEQARSLAIDLWNSAQEREDADFS